MRGKMKELTVGLVLLCAGVEIYLIRRAQGPRPSWRVGSVEGSLGTSGTSSKENWRQFTKIMAVCPFLSN